MKKITFIFLFPLLLISACGKTSSSSATSPSPSTSSEDSSSPSVLNTIYFNLTEYGLYDGASGTTYADLGLTYGYEYTAYSGTLLPAGDIVTNRLGKTFGGWVTQANSGGGLTKVTKMPGVYGMILQAWWNEDDIPTSSASSASGSSSSQSSSTVLADLYLSVDGAYSRQLSEGYSSVLNATEWSYTGSFTLGYAFTIKSQSGVLGESATTSYPHPTTAKPQAGYSLASNGTGNNTVSYLKANGYSETGIDNEGTTWCKYASNATPGTLEFIAAGTYTVYLTLWDSGGWLRIYVEPAA